MLLQCAHAQSLTEWDKNARGKHEQICASPWRGFVHRYGTRYSFARQGDRVPRVCSPCAPRIARGLAASCRRITSKLRIDFDASAVRGAYLRCRVRVLFFFSATHHLYRVAYKRAGMMNASANDVAKSTASKPRREGMLVQIRMRVVPLHGAQD